MKGKEGMGEGWKLKKGKGEEKGMLKMMKKRTEGSEQIQRSMKEGAK